MAGAETLAEVADVAGLVAAVLGAAAVGHGEAAAPLLRELGEARILGGGGGGVAGVAQHVEMEAVADAGGGEALQHRGEVADHPRRRLVADAGHEGDGGGDRLVAADAGGRGRDHRSRIAGKAHDHEADRRVPEADHRPRQGHQEQCEQHDIERIQAAGRERIGREPHEEEGGRQHEPGEQPPPPGQRGKIGLPGAGVRRGRAPGICLQHE